MSDSPRHGRKSSGALVKPQIPSEKSFIENMAGLIQEVVPQAYGSPPPIEPKEEIQWCKFETLDYTNHFSLNAEPEPNGNSPPILLTLGYSKGYQVWAILANGDAQEVISFRQGKVRCLKILPKPERSNDRPDTFSHKRPIIAICDSHGIENSLSTSSFTSVTFQSLRTGEALKTIKFKNPVVDIQANERVIVVTFPEKSAIFDSCNFEDRFTLTSCYLCPGPNLNPIALGHRWLAYAERKLSLVHKSSGGFEGEGVHSYTATVIHAAKSITKGLREMGGSLANSLIGQKSSSPPHPSAVAHPGIVTIVDLLKIGKGEVSLASEDNEGIVAHFIAHSNEPICHLQFDHSGSLLFTADKQGRNFHIFKILPHPCSSVQSSIHHLYTLYRGDTSARVHDVSFSADSRWVSVSTHRGTVHIFPMTPYGGGISVRTHTSHKVVNRLSRFHRSAGLDDKVPSGSSPTLSQSPAHSKIQEMQMLGLSNPRLAPFPTSTVITPLAQIRQPISLSSPSRLSPGSGSKSRHSSEDDLGLRVSVCFAAPRNVPPQFSSLSGPAVMREKSKAVLDSLFVLSSYGFVVEYCLEPKVSITVPRDKVNEESPIDLDFHPLSQWNLLRSNIIPDLPLPLSSTCLLILSPIKTPGDPGNLLMSTWTRADEESESSLPESWLSQVEITTYAGPHRRLWMGPQFAFKTIQPGSGSESEPTEIELTTPPPSNAKSNPVNMPRGAQFNFGDFQNSLPMVIEAGGSASSLEQSPRMNAMRYCGQRGSTSSVAGSASGCGEVENQLQESIADAMLDCGALPVPVSGGAVVHFYADNGGSSNESPAASLLGAYIARPCEFRPIREGLPERANPKRGQPVIRKDFGDVFDDFDFGTSPEVAEIFSGGFAKPAVASRCPVRTGIESAMFENASPVESKPKCASLSTLPVEIKVSLKVEKDRSGASEAIFADISRVPLSIKETANREVPSPAIFPDEFDDKHDLEMLPLASVRQSLPKEIVAINVDESISDVTDMTYSTEEAASVTGSFSSSAVTLKPPVEPSQLSTLSLSDDYSEDVVLDESPCDMPRRDSSDSSSSFGPGEITAPVAAFIPRVGSSDSDEFEIRPEHFDNDVTTPDENRNETDLPELVPDFLAKESSLPGSGSKAGIGGQLMEENFAINVQQDVAAFSVAKSVSPLGIVNENYCAKNTSEVETNLVKTKTDACKSDESEKAVLQEEEDEAETNSGATFVSRKQKRKGKKKK